MNQLFAYRHRTNSRIDLEEAKRAGFDGVECDVYLAADGPHIGHDPRVGDMLLPEYAAWAARLGLKVAYDVKSNGLARVLKQFMRPEDFVFDVPGEEIYAYQGADARYFARVSEFDLQFTMGAWGVMLDAFDADPLELTYSILMKGKNHPPPAWGVIDGPLHMRPQHPTKTYRLLAMSAPVHVICKTVPPVHVITQGDAP